MKKNYWFIIIFLFLITFQFSEAQKDEARVIAAYIHNFAQYTTWENESQLDSFRIAIFSENQNLINELFLYSQKKKIKNKPISIVVMNMPVVYNKINLILVTSTKLNYIPDIYDQIEGKPILLVSEYCKEKRNIMINLYRTEENQISFEVNKANILNQNLKIDPEILLAGGTEVDVASLFRKSQLNLRELQKRIDVINDSLKLLNDNINNSIKEVEFQKSNVIKQKELLSNNLIIIDSLTKEMDIQKSILNSQKSILKKQQDSIFQKNTILQNQLKEIEKKTSDLESQEDLHKLKQTQIEILNSDICNKNIELNNQLDVISQQKQMLMFIIITSIIIFILIITLYIAYRKNKTKSVILANQKLEIEEKLIELNDLNIRLKNADQYKSIFLASMSHELRTPLNSIIGYTGILLMGMTGQLNTEQNKQLNKVKTNAKHLLSLINDILDISKIEADKVELHIEEFYLKDIVNQVIETLTPRINEKQLKLTSELNEDLIVNTDIRRIKQVILNLLTNAVNYTDSGEIHISSGLLSDSKFRLSVKDSGIGIAESEIARLFQPFQQIDTSLTKKNGGTGLGLYLCKKIITMLGGKIMVKSELSKGSDFYIEMPINYHKEEL